MHSPGMELLSVIPKLMEWLDSWKYGVSFPQSKMCEGQINEQAQNMNWNGWTYREQSCQGLWFLSVTPLEPVRHGWKSSWAGWKGEQKSKLETPRNISQGVPKNKGDIGDCLTPFFLLHPLSIIWLYNWQFNAAAKNVGLRWAGFKPQLCIQFQPWNWLFIRPWISYLNFLSLYFFIYKVG